MRRGITDAERRERSLAILKAQAAARVEYLAESAKHDRRGTTAAGTTNPYAIEWPPVSSQAKRLHDDSEAHWFARWSWKQREEKKAQESQGHDSYADVWTDEQRAKNQAILDRRFGGLDEAGRQEARDLEIDMEAAEWRENFERRRKTEAELADLHLFRESTFVRHCKNRTGEVVTDEAFARMRDQRDKLDDDTVDIALKLESVGRSALGTGPQAYIIGLHSQKAKPTINVQKRAFLPAVAAEKRAPMIRALEFLLHTKAHRFDQFCTFTLGKRVPIDPETAGWELRSAFADKETGLHRRLSKLNAEPWMVDFGASILFRASEIGGLRNDQGELIRDAQGRVTAHPHAHCLIHFSRWLTRNHDYLIGGDEHAVRAKLGQPIRIKRHRMGAMLMVYKVGRVYLNRAGRVIATGGEMGEWTRRVWEYWGAHWSMDGAIENVREACKYFGKPDDQKALDAHTLAALESATYKLHRVQPMGEFRYQLRVRRESCLNIRKEWRRKGKERALTPVVLPCWNARKRDRKETLAQKRRKKVRASIRQAIKRDRRRTEYQINRDRKERWAKERAAHIARVQAATDLFTTSSPLPPPCPAPVTLPPYTPRKAAKTPTALKNRIVARLAPSYYFCQVSEPALLVWSDTPPTAADIEGMLSQSFVRPAVEATRAQFEEGKRSAAQVRVHTSPVTVWGQKPRTDLLPALLKPETWHQPAEMALN